MKCKILRVPVGNDFTTRMVITAVRPDGSVIDNFRLADADNITPSYILAGKTYKIEDFTIDGNSVIIPWTGLSLGSYGFVINGYYGGGAWQMKVNTIFIIVSTNERAFIPDGTLVNGEYVINEWMSLYSPAKIQSDWDEQDTDSPAYIRNKPDLSNYATKQELAQKQNVIPDLATIRSGAEKGATAYQKPSGGIYYNDLNEEVTDDLNMGNEAWTDLHDENDGLLWKVPAQASKTNQLADKDFVNSSISTATAGKQDTIPDLATIRSGAEKGATAYQKPVDGIPQTDMADDVQDFLSDAHDAYLGVYNINKLIPAQASKTNQLADKDFVNSSISTATATFKGTYNSVAELEHVTADANDYAFVISTDSAGNTVYNRYKYSNGSWTFEYALNNSSFTAAQWAAINSAITSGDVEKLAALPTKAQLDALFGAINDTLDDHGTAINQKANKTNVVQVEFPSLSEGKKLEKLQPNEIAEVSFVDYMNFAIGGLDNTQKCEYCIKFDVGSTIPTLTLPSNIKWAEELKLEANTHYVILISYENGRFYGDWKSYPLT